MRVTHLFSGVQEWPPGLHGEPPGPAPLQARHPRVVGHRMPLVRLGVRVGDLRVLHQPVAEVVDHGGDVADAAQTFIESRLGMTPPSLLSCGPPAPGPAQAALHDANRTAPAAYAPHPSEQK